MSRVVRWMGHGLPYNTKLYPGLVGRGDISYPTTVHTYPEPGSIGSGIHIDAWDGNQGGVGQYPRLKCYSNQIPEAACNVGWKFSATPHDSFAALDNYSFSFQMQIPADPPLNFNWTWLKLWNGASYVGGIMMQGGVLFDWAGVEPRKLLLLGPGGAGQGGWSSWRPNINTMYKYEVQVQPTNPKMTVRVYQQSGASWTLVHTMTANPAGSMSATGFNIGLMEEQKSIVGLQDFMLGNIHAWDTYNADGLFPNYTYQYPDVTMSVWDGTTETPVTVQGEWNGTAVVSSSDTLRNPYRRSLRGSREVVPPTFTTSPGAVSYGPDANESYVLYTPNSTMPAGGWPLMMWGVTQYFISGDANSLYTTNPEMLHHLLLNGFAVCSFAVKNAGFVAPGPTEVGPVFVRQTVGAKLATRHVLANNVGLLNPNKVITGGHSAGGFIAGNAAITRNFNDTLYGRNFTLSGNGFGGTDPSYRGILLFDPPVDLARCRQTDPTTPYWGSTAAPLFNGAGQVTAVCAFLMGYEADQNPSLAGVSMADLLTRNASVVPPIRYHVGTSDTVIFPDQEAILRAAAAAAGVAYTYQVEPGCTHEGSPVEFSQTFKPWMQSIVNAV